MYVLVITRKKRINALFVILGTILIVLCIYLFIHILIPNSKITLGNRLSFILPSSTEMSTIYITKPDKPYIQAGSIFGNELKTETIKRQGLSEITFQYPETLRMDEIQNLGQEINVHVNFKHNDNKMVGFFQVWNLNQSLEELLNNSKKMSSMTFMDFNESELKVQEMKGFLWEYVFISTTQDIKGIEVFIENGSEMYRFSMFVPKSDYKPAYKRIFLRMAKSLRIKDTVSAQLTLQVNILCIF